MRNTGSSAVASEAALCDPAAPPPGSVRRGLRGALLLTAGFAILAMLPYAPSWLAMRGMPPTWTQDLEKAAIAQMGQAAGGAAGITPTLIHYDLDTALIHGGLVEAPRFVDTLRWWTGTWVGTVPFYRPLTSYVFWLEWKAFGDREWLYVVPAALAHVIAAVLFAALLYALARRRGLRWAALAALAGALLFTGLLSPERAILNSRVFLLWKNQPDSLAAACCFAALLCYLRAQERKRNAPGAAAWYLAGCGFKEIAAPLPLAFLTLETGALRRPEERRLALRRLALMGAAALVYLAVRRLAIPGLGFTYGTNGAWLQRTLGELLGPFSSTVVFGEWLGNAVAVWAFLVTLALWAWHRRLAERAESPARRTLYPLGVATLLLGWSALGALRLASQAGERGLLLSPEAWTTGLALCFQPTEAGIAWATLALLVSVAVLWKGHREMLWLGLVWMAAFLAPLTLSPSPLHRYYLPQCGYLLIYALAVAVCLPPMIALIPSPKRLSSARSLLVILALAACTLVSGCHSAPPSNGLPQPPAPNRRAAPEKGLFRDVAEEAGLTFRWGYGSRSPLNILETARGGAAFLDYDGDGWLDILLVGDTVALYRNRGVPGAGEPEHRTPERPLFEDMTARSGLDAKGMLMGCAVGDYDNDGRPDIFITGHGQCALYRNRHGSDRTANSPTPLFEDVTARAGVGPRRPHEWSASAGFADLDNDGFLDLVVGHYVEFTPKTRQLCDFPSAGAQGKVLASCPPLYYEPQQTRFFRNRGNGTFEDVTARFPKGNGNNLGVGFADYNDDGLMDIYVANDGLPGDLYHNRGGWKFENVGTASATAYNQDGREQAGMGVDWADYDGDGRLDLIVSTFQNEPKSLYRNEGGGLFSYASYAAGIGDQTKPRLAFGVGFFDYDNDGHPDLLLANGHVQDTIHQIHPPATYAQPMQLFRNLGDGAFEEITPQGGPAFARLIVGRAIAFGDYDNDGRVDALVADLNGAPLLLHNEMQTTHHWLGVRLVSRHGKRDALGARVLLETADGKKRMAEAQTCRSYLAACDPRVHFGLGAESRVRRLTVRWPGGGVTTLENLPVDRYVVVEQSGEARALR